jgi:hypothetical protein
LNDDPDITPEMPLAFDEAGHPVAVSPPVYETPDETQDDQPGKITLADIPDLLLCGAQDDHDTAGRAAMLGYILKSQFAPQSLDELGLRLGISKQAAHKRLTTFRRKCAEILAL